VLEEGRAEFFDEGMKEKKVCTKNRKYTVNKQIKKQKMRQE
jgi:hypothetical protein